MGDPTGIGPEVTLRALAGRASRRAFDPILVGDAGVYADTAAALGMRLRLTPWEAGAALPRVAIAVREVASLPRPQRRPGRPNRAGGRAAYDAILAAVELVQSGAADALVTAPICKANLAAAGASVTGHTELLAERAGGAAVRMMMVGARLRVVLASTHVALRRVPDLLTIDGILETIAIAHTTLRERFGIARPRLVVAGLNPHAGEAGLFGDEEARIIAPAVRAAQRRRIRVDGPLAADSLFAFAADGRYDAVVCMYHDQGLAPFKLLHFADGVNFTAGLPFVRTSPDHGTAHDIAGRACADPRSMAAALQLAARLSGRRTSARARRAA
jgi:4-hydroxythreonine-4-phosphate dehydrogenase